MKDAPWWDWGRGCCNKHLGQELPCRICINSHKEVEEGTMRFYCDGELIYESKVQISVDEVKDMILDITFGSAKSEKHWYWPPPANLNAQPVIEE